MEPLTPTPIQPTGPKYPHVAVQLTCLNGNVFNLLSVVACALRDAGLGDQVDAFTAEVFNSGSYDDALAIMMAWVDVR